MKKFGFVLMLLTAAAANKALGDSMDDVKEGTADLVLTGAIGDSLSVHNPVTSSQESTIAAPYTYSVTNVVSLNTPGAPMISAGLYSGFCVDLVHDIFLNASPAPFTVYYVDQNVGVPELNLTGSTLTNVFKLFQDYYASGLIYGKPANTIAPVASEAADALTIALWAELSGQDVSVSGLNPVWTSNSYGSAGATSLASGWLSNLGSATAYNGSLNAFYSTQGVQGQEIMITAVSNTLGTPEPGSVVGLVGMGLVGCIGLVRIRRTRELA